MGSHDCSLSGVISALQVGEDILASDDGIINHDAKDEDKGEQADDVDGHAEIGHERDGACECDRDSDTNPERQPTYTGGTNSSDIGG